MLLRMFSATHREGFLLVFCTFYLLLVSCCFSIINFVVKLSFSLSVEYCTLSECVANFRILVNFILSLQTTFWGQGSLELSMEVNTK